MNSQKYGISFLQISSYILFVIYSFFCILMVNISLKYIGFNDKAAFLAIKQWIIGNQVWKTSFYIHVFCSPVLLLAGFSQFFKVNQLSNKIHRLSGRLYVIILLFLAAPSGLIMAYYANGGIWAQTAFISLAIFWIFFTFMAYTKVRNQKFNEHKKWMYRSFALTLSAITLRSWKFLIYFFFRPNPMDVYIIVAWMGWVPNLIIAEWLISRLKK